jgi:hypothetical protein
LQVSLVLRVETLELLKARNYRCQHHHGLTLRRREAPSRRVGNGTYWGPSFETPCSARLLRMRLVLVVATAVDADVVVALVWRHHTGAAFQK